MSRPETTQRCNPQALVAGWRIAVQRVPSTQNFECSPYVLNRGHAVAMTQELKPGLNPNVFYHFPRN